MGKKLNIELLNGNCLDVLQWFDDNSIDCVVTDPPYGLAFMGKKWDYDVPSVEIWCEVFRVLKPGGHVLSFGGTRTYHRMAVNIEDAGFEIRDQVQWIYGSGFPKSHNVSKAIDKMKGVDRGKIENPKAKQQTGQSAGKGLSGAKSALDYISPLPATPEAKQWDGWGSALKPAFEPVVLAMKPLSLLGDRTANEPICLARKPLEKGLTLAGNVLKWGTGAINVDECLVEAVGADKDRLLAEWDRNQSTSKGFTTYVGQKDIALNSYANTHGRWPANVLFDEEAAVVLDEMSGVLKQGGASRFFYVAKASKRERNRGLEGMPEKLIARSNEAIAKNKAGVEITDDDKRFEGMSVGKAQNHHPTVKPIKLMEYLITLITPPNGTILDPFMGSGSTGVASKNLNRKFIGIEMNEEYFEIAKKRIGVK